MGGPGGRAAGAKRLLWTRVRQEAEAAVLEMAEWVEDEPGGGACLVRINHEWPLPDRPEPNLARRTLSIAMPTLDALRAIDSALRKLAPKKATPAPE